MPLKIAQIATADCSIRILLLDHIRALQKQGHEVTAVCAPGPWIRELREAGIDVCTVDMARELHPVGDMKSLARLYRFFRQRRFDVVHTHTVKAGILGPLAARIAGIPVVVHTIHGLLFHDSMPRAKRRLFWLSEKFTAAFVDHLLSQSHEDVGVAVRSHLCPADRITYLGNGIDVQRFSPRATPTTREALRASFGFRPNDFVVGSVGRLVYEKGCAELFKAASQLTARHPQVKFLIIGSPEPDQNDAVSAKDIAELSCRNSVRFAGWRDDMPACYSAMDVFLLPSHREGIPRACMEASAMELPVVASYIRGCREVVRHRETGLLVPVGNVAEILAAIEELLADRFLVGRMGRQGRDYIVENFDQRQVLARLCEFYSRLENGHAARTAAA
ncbi:MAG: glycosyltransferase family 4 protein [Candidatus Acidiferrales bacterium]